MVKTQQYFMKELVKQTLNDKGLKLKLPELIATYIENVETNINILEMIDAFNTVKNIDEYEISTYTLPGEAETINRISYFIHNEEDTKKLIDEIVIPLPNE